MPLLRTLIARATAKIDSKQDSVSETYTAGEEKSKIIISGEGQVTLNHAGDGDFDIKTRVYVDGTLEDTIDGNAAAVVTVGFTTSLELRTYSASAITASCSSFHVVGWRFA